MFKCVNQILLCVASKGLIVFILNIMNRLFVNYKIFVKPIFSRNTEIFNSFRKCSARPLLIQIDPEENGNYYRSKLQMGIFYLHL